MKNYTDFEADIFQTQLGTLKIIFLGHGSLLMEMSQLNLYVDVFGEVADYSRLPKADLILLTHDHFDHQDPAAIQAIQTDQTKLIYPRTCEQKTPGGMVLDNGSISSYAGIQIEAIPAYNIIHKRSDGNPFHPRGIGNGYILDFGDTRVYIAGDTENTPEMKALKDIAIAFLPMNLPYTMTPEMVADAARSFRPRILYPYHFGKTDTNGLIELLKGEPGIEVRIRNLA